MTSPVPTIARPRGLSTGHFRKIATNGFGEGHNSYAWSCAWYDGHAYIGTITNLLVTLQKRIPVDMFWPVPLPGSDRDLDLRGQIWRYSPEADAWERVFLSPLIRGLKGLDTPIATGFRNMSVFQGKSDPRPALYTIPSCNRTHGLGPVLLRSVDGVNFAVASEPGLGLGDTNVITYRGNLAFKGKLFVSPSGSRTGQSNVSLNPVILCSDDPASGRWEVSNPIGFGDPTNHGIFDLGVCGGHLFAGTINIREGCQLWKTDGEGPPPHRWTKVFDRGADRGPHNQLIMSFAEYRGAMYVGTGIQNGGHDRLNNIGPAAGEVLRVHPDDSWDLVIGEPRMTRHGLKVPSSGLGPGFDNPLTGYIWRMRVHDGSLYVGTYDASSLLPFGDPKRWPLWLQRNLEHDPIEHFLETRGGCELWRTDDGDHWVDLTRNGFGNRFNWGVRSLLSTPKGLFVGTANPFGPRVAVLGPGGWRYEDNPRGGLEVWHGSLDHSGPAGRPADSDSIALLADVSMRAGPGAAMVDNRLSRVSDLENPGSEGDEWLDALTEQACRDDPAPPRPRHAVGDARAEVEREGQWQADPVQTLSGADKDLIGLSEDVGDELADYYGRGELRNVGYWRERRMPPRRACAHLLDELFALLPADGTGSAAESILALGVGLGDAELGVPRLRPSASVTARSIEEATRRRRLWGFGGRSARTRLVAADASFDLVIWVEGPSARDRIAALREAHRVLRPGGRLLAADLIGRPIEDAGGPAREVDAAALAAAYRRDVELAGLVDPLVVDVTRQTWLRFYRHSRAFFATKVRFRQIDREKHAQVLATLPGGGLAVSAYFLVSAAKP